MKNYQRLLILGFSSCAVYAVEPEREQMIQSPKRATVRSSQKRRDTPLPFGACDVDEGAPFSYQQMAKTFHVTPLTDRSTESVGNRDTSAFELKSPAKDFVYSDILTGKSVSAPYTTVTYMRTPSSSIEEEAVKVPDTTPQEALIVLLPTDVVAKADLII